MTVGAMNKPRGTIPASDRLPDETSRRFKSIWFDTTSMIERPMAITRPTSIKEYQKRVAQMVIDGLLEKDSNKLVKACEKLSFLRHSSDKEISDWADRTLARLCEHPDGKVSQAALTSFNLKRQ
ncbi:MAG: hypothetical protein V1909_01280 [Candidatus Micrarchaeota archaeon]